MPALSVPWSAIGQFPRSQLRVANRASMIAARYVADKQARSIIDAKLMATRPHPPVDRGLYRRGWKWKKTKKGALIMNFTPQAAVMETGRRRGKYPPFNDRNPNVKFHGVSRLRCGPVDNGVPRSYQSRTPQASFGFGLGAVIRR